MVDPLTDAVGLAGIEGGRDAVIRAARALRYAVLVVDEGSPGGGEVGEKLAYAAQVARMPGSPPLALILDGGEGWDAGGAAAAARGALSADRAAVAEAAGCVVVLVGPGE